MGKGDCHLFLGPEIGEKQDAVEELRRNLKKHYGALEEASFYAGETPVSDMVSVLRNGSLFADARLFFIKNAEAVQKKEELELLASYLASPQDDTVLILISETTSVNKGLEKALPRDHKRIFWELFEGRKTAWVSSFFRRGGYEISEAGIEAVLELVENNTDALRRECSRLMLFAEKDQVIGGEAVEKWLSHTREESAFTLFSRIASGDLVKSIETMRILLAAKEAPPAVLAGLAWCFRKLRDYLALTARGSAGEVDLKRIGLASPQIRRDYTAAARRYNAAGADQCLSLIAEYDVLLRSAGAGLELILSDMFLYKLHACGAGAGSAGAAGGGW
jgi:DNA polymerase-3 subunit delta